jgi:hypothetical protein
MGQKSHTWAPLSALLWPHPTAPCTCWYMQLYDSLQVCCLLGKAYRSCWGTEYRSCWGEVYRSCWGQLTEAVGHSPKKGAVRQSSQESLSCWIQLTGAGWDTAYRNCGTPSTGAVGHSLQEMFDATNRSCWTQLTGAVVHSLQKLLGTALRNHRPFLYLHILSTGDQHYIP